MNQIRVPLGGYLLAESPAILVCQGVGSCVVVALYDGQVKLAAVAHIMLPGPRDKSKSALSAQYSDQAIEEMVEELARRGSSRARLVAKMAGGAQMFLFSSLLVEESPGKRNVEAVVRKLSDLGIPLVASDVGRNFGRTVEFHTDSGQMIIRTVCDGTRVI
ncbi:MAG: chemotaxis protein CheD [candidate division NC10 bacterium]|nr:chemotaxis protein CheD [candidate division NC10 bacterium]